MGVKTFEEMLEDMKEQFRNALLIEEENEDSSINIAKTMLDLCTNDFEEQTVVENFREVFEEVMDELRES